MIRRTATGRCCRCRPNELRGDGREASRPSRPNREQCDTTRRGSDKKDRSRVERGLPRLQGTTGGPRRILAGAVRGREFVGRSRAPLSDAADHSQRFELSGCGRRCKRARLRCAGVVPGVRGTRNYEAFMPRSCPNEDYVPRVRTTGAALPLAVALHHAVPSIAGPRCLLASTSRRMTGSSGTMIAPGYRRALAERQSQAQFSSDGAFQFVRKRNILRSAGVRSDRPRAPGLVRAAPAHVGSSPLGSPNGMRTLISRRFSFLLSACACLVAGFLQGPRPAAAEDIVRFERSTTRSLIPNFTRRPAVTVRACEGAACGRLGVYDTLILDSAPRILVADAAARPSSARRNTASTATCVDAALVPTTRPTLGLSHQK